ncbi:AAA family ATPase [Xanthobacter oligotrophicus]|uniref:bifunctional aminoglycoside phosphotransferase/ATP-binding protein n=1 Tax=Xanthobacter oligotrophicus TaxID=2607286 RepID=UPI0011F3F6E8|nr:bifunctional aminoglycoside phosphotransferase/ATP-binding protein [Xanthobacter oligotrophicus]MCG5235683.1 AAA family ATPase [Xanthobacter oligotrophicus]
MTAPTDTPAPPAAPDHVVGDQSAVFALLEDPATHGITDKVVRIDTHGAAVFLAGPFAYKVKRAVFFPFMDFSTPQKRHAACEAEVAISGAGAPGLYLGVVPIVRTPNGLALGGAGETVEHAVKMHRFDTDLTLDKVAERGELSPDLAKALAAAVATAHAAAPVRRGFDTASRLAAYLADNTREFSARPELFPPQEVARLARLAEDALAGITPLLKTRSAAGFVRRCHGDMHLRNIVLLDGKPVLFDAIEFNDDIATCDVLYDLAFLLMDLWQRRLPAQANAILNRYLWASADDEIDGLAALPLFLSLRSAIRAKVEAAGLAHLAGAQRVEGERRVTHAFQQALDILGTDRPKPVQFGQVTMEMAKPAPPILWAVGGLSGSGKSTWAARMAPALGRAPGAVILRSDIERKRLAGVAETQKLSPQAYTPEATQLVYARLRTLAAQVLTTGHSVIVDAVHARSDEREAIAKVARAAGADFHGWWLEAPKSELIRRVEARTGDASDADAAVVRRQLSYDLGDISWTRARAFSTAPLAAQPSDPHP